jgi:HEPN domain-containing protein
MSGIEEEWLQKAEGDFHTAFREFRARKQPNYDAACFHAQQCIEKCLKALLIRNQIEFNRVHDLEILLNAALALDPLLDALRSDAQLLTQYAVSFRYPGESADKTEVKDAVSAMKNCKEAILLRIKS